ncbi:helix-turn-helix domain-containing protein [Cupriavidus basilensis]
MISPDAPTQTAGKARAARFADQRPGAAPAVHLRHGQPRTMREVAEQLDVTRAAARRLLLTLQHSGYVAQDGRDFSITPRVMDLGFAYFASMDLPRAGPT